MDHDRRAHLLRAREELRRQRRVRHSRRALRLVNSVGYPALIAPAWFAESVRDVLRGGSSHQRPADGRWPQCRSIFWGRRMMSPAYAALASALVLLMPSLLYTGMLMTENAFFPAFVATTYRDGPHARAADPSAPSARPDRRSPSRASCEFRRSCSCRSMRWPWGSRSSSTCVRPAGRGASARSSASFAATSPLPRSCWSSAAAMSAMKLLQGAPLEDGARGLRRSRQGRVRRLERGRVDCRPLRRAHLLGRGDPGIGAHRSARARAFEGARRAPAERALLAVATSAIVLTVVEVGIFASRFALRVEERNMFSVVPLLFLAFSLWLARGLPRPLVLTAVAALAPAALLLTLPLGRLLNIGVLSDTFGFIPLLSAHAAAGHRCRDRQVAHAGRRDRGGSRVCAPPPQAGPRCAPVGGRAGARAGVRRRVRLDPRPLARNAGADGRGRAELDRRGDRHWRRGGVLSTGRPAILVGEAQILWQTEFWNRSVGTVYRLGPPEPAPLSEAVASTRPGSRGGSPRADPGEGDPVRRSPRPRCSWPALSWLARRGWRSTGSSSPMRFATLAGGGLRGRLDGQRRGLHAVRHVQGSARPAQGSCLA